MAKPQRSTESPACFVYVLGAGGAGGFKTYVGWTTDLERRLALHNAGKGARTTRGRVWKLLYAEAHATRAAALSREHRLKRDRALRKRLAADCRPVARGDAGHVTACPNSSIVRPRSAKLLGARVSAH